MQLQFLFAMVSLLIFKLVLKCLLNDLSLIKLIFKNDQQFKIYSEMYQSFVVLSFLTLETLFFVYIS